MMQLVESIKEKGVITHVMLRKRKMGDMKWYQATGKKVRSGIDLAKERGDSQVQIYRYIRLIYLVPELLEFVDNRHFTKASTV